MNDIVVGVRLNADGSGLVGQLRLSRTEMDQLRASEKGAAEAARDLSAATGQAAAASGKGAQETRKGAAARKEAAEAAREESRALADFRRMLDPAAIEQAKLNRQLELADILHRRGALTEDQHREVQRRLADATGGLNDKIGLQRAGWQQLGFQMQDIGIQYSMNTRLSQIFAMQSGQVFGAISMIAQGSEKTTGSLGKFASLMGGPWGIAIGTGVSLAAMLWSELSKVDDASEGASKSTINFSSSLVAQQGIVANSADGIRQLEEATRSLINTQAILVDNLKLVSQSSVSQLRTQLSELDRQIADKSQTANSLLANVPGTFGIFGNGGAARADVARLTALRADVVSRLATAERSLTDARVSLEERAAVERADPDAAERGAIDRERARLRERRQYTLNQANDVPLADAPSLQQISAGDFDKQMADLTRRENALKNKEKPKKDNSAAKAAREAERLANFGERAEDAIARLNDQFNAAPRDIDQARAATDKLDAIIADLEKRKPPNYQQLIDQAKAVKPLIQDSLVRPIREMLDGQERQIELGKLQTSGRQADAAALQLTYSLMDKMGVESEDQLATALAQRGVTEEQVRALYDNLEVLRQQTREMRVQQAIQNMFLGAVDDMRENVRLTVESLRKDGPKAIEDFGKRFLDVFDRLFADVATETLFGDFFRDLEDQLTGDDKVSKAGDKLAEEVGRAGKSIKQTSGDILDLGKAVRQAVAAITNTPVSTADAAIGGISTDTSGVQGVADIIVDGRKGTGFKEGYQGFFKDLKGSFKDIFGDVFGEKGIFSESLGKKLGEIGAGAQMGASAGNLVTGLLGIKGSSTGGAIGGALGTAIAGPLGSIVGGTLGSVVGGLMKSTPKASATITGGSADDVSVSGNKDSLKKASVGLASSVQDTLQQIADEFGGTLGNFAVSIGVRHGDYRVDTSGSGKTKKKSGAVDFDDDEAGAIAYAVMDAITDGGIIGISAAVQKALNSSSDLDEAVAEALKVREVEKLLGGLGAELEEQFKTFEDQAKERVRIATQYGFDVVEIEKRNAEDRAKLIDEILTDRVGSLQQLLDDMKHGDLFEGSATDRREALLVEIAKTRTAAEAGEDGAADKLANLLRQLTELSREAYGTAGEEYSTDRDSAISAAEAVIKAENDRIKQAQDAVAATNSKLDTANQLADEQVQYLAQIAAKLGVQATTASTGSVALNTSLVARQN